MVDLFDIVSKEKRRRLSLWRFCGCSLRLFAVVAPGFGCVAEEVYCDLGLCFARTVLGDVCF